MSSTRILKVKIAGGSAKIRAGMPSDEKKDLAKDELLDTVWTGVLPAYQGFGTPVPGPYNRVKQVPEHVTDFLESVAGNEASATEITKGKEPRVAKLSKKDEED
jgi:hypothetical protein